MHKPSLLLFITLCFPQFVSFSALAQTWAPSPREEHFISIAGIQRRYLVHFPPNFDRKNKTPLILMLHGGGGTPQYPGDHRLSDAADPKGFIVVYPEGVNRGWNDGRAVEGRTADDVGFLASLIDQMIRDYNVNPKRVYSTGISNGGFMSLTLACRLADKIAAVAPVAGSMGQATFDSCKPARAISLMMINGTGDPIVKYEGGPIFGRGDSVAITRVVEFWRKQECAGAKVESRELPDVDPNDDSNVKVESVVCPSAEVINYIVEGGGHTWPGGAQYFRKRWSVP